jgi:hypothetical protein
MSERQKQNAKCRMQNEYSLRAVFHSRFCVLHSAFMGLASLAASDRHDVLLFVLQDVGDLIDVLVGQLLNLVERALFVVL